MLAALDDEGPPPARRRKRAAKKPKRSARAPKAKPPCKYGPRGADGFCPKKPKSPRKARELRVRDYESVRAAGRQAGQVFRSDKATGEQKKEAAKVLGTAIATESGKKVAEHTYREARKTLRTQEGKEALRAAAPVLKSTAKALGTATFIAGTLAAGGEILDANRLRESERWADQELKNTEKRLGRRLTDEEHETLRRQYIEWKYKQPVVNPFLGK
jgi:hypothetical protein